MGTDETVNDGRSDLRDVNNASGKASDNLHLQAAVNCNSTASKSICIPQCTL